MKSCLEILVVFRQQILLYSEKKSFFPKMPDVFLVVFQRAPNVIVSLG